MNQNDTNTSFRFIAKPETWYDENTEAVLLSTTGTGIDGHTREPWLSGLFVGYVKGELDEEVCGFDEFYIVDEDFFSWDSNKNIKRIIKEDIEGR